MANNKQDKQNSHNLAETWRDYIDWEKRRRGEDSFLINQLNQYGVKKVFDACLGDGCDSIYLLKQRLDVVGNDIDEAFLKKSKENAKKEKINLQTTSIDWRRLDQKNS